MTVQDKRVPQRVRRTAQGLEFDWDGSGEPVHFDAGALRLACPCAGCVDEMSRRPILDPDSVPADIAVVAVELVGAYGLRIRWSDGHSTGIYTFEWFRGAVVLTPLAAEATTATVSPVSAAIHADPRPRVTDDR